MYFTNKNNFFHGIMFHHFHDGKTHLKSQGSISKDEFYKIIKFIGRNNILDADIFFSRLKENSLSDRDVCFTFDDGIKCQFDIALPILEDLQIKSFFFVYTSMFEGEPDNLEVFRYFRMNYFEHINIFYEKFYEKLDRDLNKFFISKKNQIIQKKIISPYYSEEDIRFRLIRDEFLEKKDYERLMFKMFDDYKFNYRDHYSKLFFSANDLNQLDKLGHSIGFHSHNHPTLITKLSFLEQKQEYIKCINIISKILNKPKKYLNFMSYPNGNYNNDTLKILKSLKIELGFRHNMSIDMSNENFKINNTKLEIARQNHSTILNQIKEENFE